MASKGFEDKLSKMVRLLRALNEAAGPEMDTERQSICVTIGPDGSGQVHIGETIALAIYSFDDMDSLMEYLEGGQLKRLILTSRQ